MLLWVRQRFSFASFSQWCLTLLQLLLSTFTPAFSQDGGRICTSSWTRSSLSVWALLCFSVREKFIEMTSGLSGIDKNRMKNLKIFNGVEKATKKKSANDARGYETTVTCRISRRCAVCCVCLMEHVNFISHGSTLSRIITLYQLPAPLHTSIHIPVNNTTTTTLLSGVTTSSLLPPS